MYINTLQMFTVFQYKQQRHHIIFVIYHLSKILKKYSTEKIKMSQAEKTLIT